MTTILLLSALIILLCVLFNKLSSKIGVPMLLAFILLGMVFGVDGVLRIRFDDFAFAEQVCSFALIFIMFYGGFGTKWSEARPVAVKATLLSTLGVFLTAGLVGLFCRFVLGIELLESLLIGAVISSTDAASVFSIMRSKKLGLRDNTSSLLELESGSNDPSSYMLTLIVLSIMGGRASGGQVAYMVFAQFAYGIGIGAVIALGAVQFFKRFHFGTAGFDMAFLIGVALLAYALPGLVGGNGYLSVYIVGIVLGNSRIPGKKSLVNFFDGVTGLMQMLIFFLLGLLATPSQMPGVLAPALLIALFLTLLGRPLAVFALLAPCRCGWRQMLLISFAGLRGAASIVFAILATVDEAYLQNDVFHIVFCIVLFSILFQGTFIPWVAKKLDMIDTESDVLKTFTDYSDEIDLEFIKLSISADHPWQDKALRELALPPDALIVLVLRGSESLVPNGSTVLRAGDIAVLSAPSFHDETHAIRLLELPITRSSPWIGKTIAEFSPHPDELVMMILRGRHTVIPNGGTVIREKDVLVINERVKQA
ncbi:MAG: potassium/proton antiporter [Eubacteriales bacterium]|nr:potassium/proton antiporter [Eubacteriales bacterium]